MVDFNQYYKNESDYLKAEDLPPGKKFSVTIKGISVVEFDQDGKKSQKLALSFSETEKKLTVNKTNGTVIASVYGGETDHWIGRKIYVFRAKVQFGDKMVDAVRVDMPMEEASFSTPVAPARQAAHAAAATFQAPPTGQPTFDESDIPF